MIQVGRLGQADVDAAAGHPLRRVRRGLPPPRPRAAVSRRVRARPGCAARTSTSIPKGCALARSASEVVGVGFAHPRGAVTSIGPLAARPGAPAGVARALMSELGEIAAGSDQRPAVPGQLQPRLVRPLHAARLRGRRRRPVPARREARAARARHARTRPCGRWSRRRPARRRALRPIAHRRRPAPRSRAARVDGRRLRASRARGAASASPATSSIARCRRAS